MKIGSGILVECKDCGEESDLIGSDSHYFSAWAGDEFACLNKNVCVANLKAKKEKIQ